MLRNGQALRDIIANRMPISERRINLMAMSCMGLQPRDMIYIAPSLSELTEIANSMGLRCIGHPAMASVIIQDRPREPELLTKLANMREGHRMIVFNDEADIINMPERCFQLVTACVFDLESKRVLRIFDGYKPRKVESYIDVELSDISDAALTINATRIAGLR